MPAPMAGFYMLGLVTGTALFPVWTFGRVSPSWMRGLILGCQLVIAAHYCLLGQMPPAGPDDLQWFRPVWLAQGAQVIVSAVVLDQLIRHPAMSPRRLLLAAGPFAAVPVLAAIIGPGAWTAWGTEGALTAFHLLYAAVGGFLLLKIRMRRLQGMLALLLIAHLAFWASQSRLVPWRSSAWADVVLYCSLAFAYQTSAALHDQPLSL